MGFNKSKSKRKSKNKTSRKRRGGKLAKEFSEKQNSPESIAALNQAKKDSNNIEIAKKNLSLWSEAPCNLITSQEVKKWDNWIKENNLSPELVEPLKQKYKGCIEKAKQEIQNKKRPKRKAPMSPDNPNFCEYCNEVKFNDPYCKKCKKALSTKKETPKSIAEKCVNNGLNSNVECDKCKTFTDDKGKKTCGIDGGDGKKHNSKCYTYCDPSKSKTNENFKIGNKNLELWNKEKNCNVINDNIINAWKKWTKDAGLSEDAMNPLLQTYKQCKSKEEFIDSLNKWSKQSCDVLTKEKIDEFDNWKKKHNLDDNVMKPLLSAFKKCKKKQQIETFKINLNKWAKSNCDTIKTAPVEDFEKWRKDNNLKEKLMEPLKKALDKCKFIDQKKAEGAAKKAERAAAKAEAAAAASTGEGIAELMHDGTCERHKDCPSDKPKCNNGTCMTQQAFTEIKKEEGAAKRAERAIERAASIEEAKNLEIPEDMREMITYDYFDKYLRTFSNFIDNLPDNNKLKKYANA